MSLYITAVQLTLNKILQINIWRKEKSTIGVIRILLGDYLSGCNQYQDPGPRQARTYDFVKGLRHIAPSGSELGWVSLPRRNPLPSKRVNFLNLSSERRASTQLHSRRIFWHRSTFLYSNFWFMFFANNSRLKIIIIMSAAHLFFIYFCCSSQFTQNDETNAHGR